MTALARLGAAVLSDERGRKAVGWIVAAILSPVILAAAVLCSVGAGGEAHNRAAISACFCGVSYTEKIPNEFREHITDTAVLLRTSCRWLPLYAPRLRNRAIDNQ